MYRQGIGDCFLLTLPGVDSPVHILIDCGVLLGQESGVQAIRAVAADILMTTGGRLELIVVTHQHWDHLSGFIDAQDIFEQIHIGAVWLPWTEDPSNPVARALRVKRRRRVRALSASLIRMQGANTDTRLAHGVTQVLRFFGTIGDASSTGVGAARRRTTEAALAYLLRRDDAALQYLSPGGETHAIPGAKGARVYVLGPPKDERLLKRSNPSRHANDVYELEIGLELEAAFLAGMQANDADDMARRAPLTLPFENHHRLAEGEASCQPFFRARYGFAANDENAWRRIPQDWLSAAGQLALDLDRDTNNTSLVLAIELNDSGRVLLFPADAQLGSWQSWGAYTWEVSEGSSQRKRVDAADLLKRTVFYKVGHHASYNATLKVGGLEQMTSPELVAFIPVDKATAKRQGWNMPFPPLLKRLHERARGRVIRSDEGCPTEAVLKKAEALGRAQREAFIAASSETPLYIDFHVEM